MHFTNAIRTMATHGRMKCRSQKLKYLSINFADKTYTYCGIKIEGMNQANNLWKTHSGGVLKSATYEIPLPTELHYNDNSNKYQNVGTTPMFDVTCAHIGLWCANLTNPLGALSTGKQPYAPAHPILKFKY